MAKNEPSANDDKAAALAKAGDSTKAPAGKPEAPEKALDAAGDTAKAPGGAELIAAPQQAPQQAPEAGAAPAAAIYPVDDARPVAIEVISRVDGFWRGDRQWTIEPQTVPLNGLTERQLDEIVREPLLIKRLLRAGDR